MNSKTEIAPEWRSTLIDRILKLSLALGVVVYVPSVYLVLVVELWWVVAVDTFAVLGIAYLALARPFSFRIRALSFGAICYLIGISLPPSLGPIGPMYLLGYSVLMAVLLGSRAGLFSASLNGISLLVAGIARLTTFGAQEIAGQAVIVANFIFVNVLLVAAVGGVIARLETSLDREREARATAEAERALAEKARAELVEESRRRNEVLDALRQSEERFRELAENVQDVFYVRDLKGGETYVSPRYDIVWGRPSLDASDVESPLLQGVHKDDAATVRDAQTRQASGEPTAIDYRIVRPDGETRWIHDRAFPVFSAGAVIRIVGAAQDITDHRALEQEVLRAQRIDCLGELAGGIAHDLNNILTPILIIAEMLEPFVESEEASPLLEILQQSAERGGSLVAQILGIARGGDSKRRVVDLNDIVRETCRMVADTFPRDIDLVTTLAPEPANVSIDPTQFQQILLNLCVNARHAMPTGGKLRVTVENVALEEVFGLPGSAHAPGSHMLVTVEDTGCGIEEEIRDKIFEPFFSTRDVGEGTGLGLSTSARIAKDHGGFMNVDSVVGKGSTFKVYLPLANPDGVPSESTTDAAPRGGGELLLFVEDEDEIRQLAQAVLQRAGYQVVTAAHGAEAISYFAQHAKQVGLVLTDIEMPVMDGTTMLAALRAIDPDVAVVFLTGQPQGSDGAERAGPGSNVIQKPYSTGALLQVVHDALRRAR